MKDGGFMLGNFLNLFAGAIGPNHKRRFCRLRRLEGERETRLTRELPQESFSGTLEAWFSVTCERHRKCRIDFQAARSELDIRGKRHQIQCRLLSCSHRSVRQNTKNNA